MTFTPSHADRILSLIPGFLLVAGYADARKRGLIVTERNCPVPDYEAEGTLWRTRK
jgi:hypothetical protein